MAAPFPIGSQGLVHRSCLHTESCAPAGLRGGRAWAGRGTVPLPWEGICCLCVHLSWGSGVLAHGWLRGQGTHRFVSHGELVCLKKQV